MLALCYAPSALAVLALAYGDNLVFGLGSLLWVLLPSCSPRQLAVLLLLLLWVLTTGFAPYGVFLAFSLYLKGIPTFTDIFYRIVYGSYTILQIAQALAPTALLLVLMHCYLCILHNFALSRYRCICASRRFWLWVLDSYTAIVVFLTHNRGSPQIRKDA